MRAYARPFAAILAVAGMAVFGWVAVTLVWGEPISAITTSRAQGALRVELAEKKTVSAAADRAESPADLRRRAAAFGARLREGDAVGTIVVPRLGLRMVVVEGTSASQLARGPGRYRMTSLPGLGRTVAIAAVLPGDGRGYAQDQAPGPSSRQMIAAIRSCSAFEARWA